MKNLACGPVCRFSKETKKVLKARFWPAPRQYIMDCLVLELDPPLRVAELAVRARDRAAALPALQDAPADESRPAGGIRNARFRPRVWTFGRSVWDNFGACLGFRTHSKSGGFAPQTFPGTSEIGLRTIFFKCLP